MLDVVFLNGSARADGNTAWLLSRIKSLLPDDKINAEIIHISNLNINYCLGCHSCEQTKKCVQQDDVERIYTAFKNADLICVASPSYWGDVTGQLKVFFDRSTPYCNTIDGVSAFPDGKNACALAVRAGKNKAENQAVLASIEHYFSHLDTSLQFSETFEQIRSIADLKIETATSKIREFSEKILQMEADRNLFII